MNPAYTDQLEDKIFEMNKISADMKKVYKTAIDINRSKEIDLEKKLRKLTNMTSSRYQLVEKRRLQIKFNQFSVDINEVEEQMAAAKRNIDGVFRKNFTVRDFVQNNATVQQNALAMKLQELKAKIQMSKHIVDEVFAVFQKQIRLNRLLFLIQTRFNN